MKIPDFIQAGLIGLKTGCALVGPAGQIIEHDLLFPVWAVAEQRNLVGLPLLDLLPELIGQEEGLESVRQGAAPFFRMDHINRRGFKNDIRYLMVTIIPGEPNAGVTLAVLLTDITEQGLQIQELTQNRNELRLNRRKLAELSYQLDYLLRHYLSPEVADALLRGELQPQPGGELQEMSILFADVRDFTPLAERLPPEQLVQLLNEHLDVIVGAVAEFDGIISQFQADNLMVMFSASAEQPNHAQSAVETGVALQRALTVYDAKRSSEEPRLHFGVGINTGMALVGNVGAQRRYTYTAIGDTVNLAARITAAASAGEVWFSQATYEQLKGGLPLEPLPPLFFKGRSQPTPLFRVKI